MKLKNMKGKNLFLNYVCARFYGPQLLFNCLLEYRIFSVNLFLSGRSFIFSGSVPIKGFDWLVSVLFYLFFILIIIIYYYNFFITFIMCKKKDDFPSFSCIYL